MKTASLEKIRSLPHDAPDPRDRQHITRTPIQRILVVVDPATTEHPCIAKAMHIARVTGATLELYVCSAEMDLPESWAGESRAAEYREITRQRQLQELQRLAAPLRAAGIKVDTMCEQHPPLEEGIGQHIIRTQPDLVVKDTHRYPLQSRSITDHTDWALIRQSPAPLLLVRARPWPVRPAIALAVDPARSAECPALQDIAIAGMGLALQDALGASMQLLHVFGTPPHLPGDIVPEAIRLQAQARSRTSVAAFAFDAGIPESLTHFANGSPAHGIVELVITHQPALLVMGSLSRMRYIHSPAAATAVQVLQQVDCDLLVMKPAGFISPLLITEE